MPAPYHGVGGPIPIRHWRDDELLPAQAAFLAACRTLGFAVTADHNAPGSSGVGPAPANVREGMRVSTAIAYLSPARGRHNLAIRARCLVDRILLEGTHGRSAFSLECDGVPEQVFSKRVTLCGGVIGVPTVLLRSGIGLAADLQEMGSYPWSTCLAWVRT
jgi:choline dehydrogenase